MEDPRRLLSTSPSPAISVTITRTTGPSWTPSVGHHRRPFEGPRLTSQTSPDRTQFPSTTLPPFTHVTSLVLSGQGRWTGNCGTGGVRYGGAGNTKCGPWSQDPPGKGRDRPRISESTPTSPANKSYRGPSTVVLAPVQLRNHPPWETGHRWGVGDVSDP